MKSTGGVILQALLFTVIMVLISTAFTSFSGSRGFVELLFRWVTVVQFVVLFLIWSFFFYFRNKRIKDQENQK